MKFLIQLIITWLLNLLCGGFVIGLLTPTFESSSSFLTTKFILPTSIENVIGNAFMHAAWAAVISCWLFIIIIITYFIALVKDKNYKQLVVAIYWIGSVIYFFGIWLLYDYFPIFLISYLFFGLLYFKVVLNIKLWSFRKQ